MPFIDNKCTYPGCKGNGHINGKFKQHRTIKSCPLKKLSEIRLDKVCLINEFKF